MYCDEYTGGLGAVVANCSDPVMALLAPEVCAGRGSTASTPAPPPSAPSAPTPKTSAPMIAPTILTRDAETIVTRDPVALPPAPLERPASPILTMAPSTPTTVTLPTATGGWGAPQGGGGPASLSIGPTEVLVEAEDTPRGFGLVELAMTAALGWVLSQTWQDRKRKGR